MAGLKNVLTKGTELHGLKTLLKDANVDEEQAGKVVSKGVREVKWSYSKRILGKRKVTFSDGEGGNRVKVLPYAAGGINSTPMTGLPVISGEFSGCLMSIFKQSGEGAQRVGHVCTDTNLYGGNCKKQWAKMQSEKSIEISEELSTKDMVVDKVFAAPQEKRQGLSMNLKVLCLAEPDKQISHFFVLRNGDVYTVQ